MAMLQMGVDESIIPESERIPRFTSASWRYETGAIGEDAYVSEQTCFVSGR